MARNTPVLSLLVSVLALGGAAATATDAPRSGSSAALASDAPRSGPIRTASEGLALGDEAWRAGQLERALYMFVQAQQLDPASELPLLKIGAIQESRGQHELARQAFGRAVELSPGNAAAHERLGFLWLREGEHENAAGAFTEAARLDPARWRSCMGLGLAAEQRRDLASARLHYDAALKMRPRSAELLVHSARVRMLGGDLDAALAEARASLELGPSDSAWLAIGDITARKGDWPGGLEAYHKVLSESAAYFRLGEQAMMVAQYERALDYFEQAAHAAPTYFEAAQKNLAVARERLAEKRRTAGQGDGQGARSVKVSAAASL